MINKFLAEREAAIRNNIAGTFHQHTTGVPKVTDTKRKQAIQKSMDIAFNDMLEKGEISDVLGKGYGCNNKPLEFAKTGKELKEKLPVVIAALKAELVLIETQMATLKTTIGIEPTSPRNSYYMKSIKTTSYPWEMCEPKWNEAMKTYDERTEQMVCCSKFNTLCNMWMEISEDIAASTTIMNNVEDKKTYTLTVSQLVALSF